MKNLFSTYEYNYQQYALIIDFYYPEEERHDLEENGINNIDEILERRRGNAYCYPDTGS
jgi:hypothetical protein